VVYVKRGEDLVKTLCILDTAAGHSTIDKGFALSLGFELTDHEVKKINYLDRKVMLETARCEFELVSQDKTKSFKIQADAVKGFADNCLLWPWHKFVPRHPHLKDVNPPACPIRPLELSSLVWTTQMSFALRNMCAAKDRSDPWP